MATAKGHLKRPKKGIRSTTPKRPHILTVPASVPDVLMPGLDESDADNDDDIFDANPCFNIIDDVDDPLHCQRFLFRRICRQNNWGRLQRLYRRIPVHVARRQRLFFRYVPLRNKRNSCHADSWTRLG